MNEHRITLHLTQEEIASLDRVITELTYSWTHASPTLLSKLRREVVRVKYTSERATPKNVRTPQGG